MLYTKLGSKCDQQVTVIGHLLSALGRVYRHRVLSKIEVKVIQLSNVLPSWVLLMSFSKKNLPIIFWNLAKKTTEVHAFAFI